MERINIMNGSVDSELFMIERNVSTSETTNFVYLAKSIKHAQYIIKL